MPSIAEIARCIQMVEQGNQLSCIHSSHVSCTGEYTFSGLPHACTGKLAGKLGNMANINGNGYIHVRVIRSCSYIAMQNLEKKIWVAQV